MTQKHYTFTRTSLRDYTFTIREDVFYGYDQQGRAWKESEFTEMRNKGLIIKECFIKSVFFEDILLGYIREGFDGTWLALSPYNHVILEGIEIYGFMNEFYAVRYLHQIIKAVYPDEIEDFPCLP